MPAIDNRTLTNRKILRKPAAITRCHAAALLGMASLLCACSGEPVRIGIREARAAGVVHVRAEPGKAATPAQWTAGEASAQTQRPAAAVRKVAAKTVSSGSDDIVSAPKGLPQPHGPDDIVGLRLEGVTPGHSGKQDVTFGEIFGPGQVPSGTDIAAVMNGQAIPAQLDRKTSYPDGSVRMGIVTFAAPRAGDVMLVRRAHRAASPDVDLSNLASAGYNLSVDLVLHGTDGDKPAKFDVAALLAKALRTHTASDWLQGPLATEARVEVPVASSLRLTFDIRSYADGTTLTDVEFNNDIALQPVGGDQHYDVSFIQNGKTVFEQHDLTQFQYQTWHHEVWNNGTPHLNVVHDVAALARAGAIQNYDLATGVSGKLLGQEQRQMAGPGFGILENGGIVKFMPMTGGRADIGPTTLGNTIWLITQSPVARDFALAQADAAGTVPWHFFDTSTGTYITLTTHPRFWTDPRGGSNGVTGLTQQIDRKAGWALDGAHQPDLSYIPYILTGSHYYLDQLDAQAAWSLIGIWPAPRENGKGIVVSSQAQVRSQAWNLREILEAAYATPDASPLKSYFQQMVKNNFDYFLNEIHTDHEGEAYGWKQGVYGNNDGAIAPWQQDYLATSIILASEQGVPDAKQVLTWQTHFLAGRFLAADKGLPPYDGAPYNMYMYPKGSTEPFQTWREIEAALVLHKQSGGGTGWPPNTFGDYFRAAEGVLSGIITVTGAPEAKQALSWLSAHAPRVTDAIKREAPTWNIVPIPKP